MAGKSSTDSAEPFTPLRPSLSWSVFLPVVVAVAAVLCATYVRMHPLVFNESFLGHHHCIACTVKGLAFYALDNEGRYPAHPNGYGDALLMIYTNVNVGSLLTGPGYEGKIFDEAARTNGHVPEAACGRVYVQGLTDKDYGQIVLLFDKLPTPGGDHCTGFHRLTAALGREVALVDGSTDFIPETHWPAYASNQVRLLVEAGISRAEAERLYAAKPK